MKNTNQGALYVDVTDFLTWRGHFTGIQRVVYSLTNEIISKKEKVVLVVSSNGIYQSISQDLDDIAKRGVMTAADLQGQDIGPGTAMVRRREKVPLILRKLTHPIVYVLRRGRRKLIPTFRKYLHQLRELKGSLGLYNPNERIASDVNQPKLSYGDAIEFNDSDTLMVLGCLWDNADHLDSALLAVEHHNVKLIACIYDLIPVYGSHTFGEGLGGFYSKYLFEVLSVATSVISISKATTADIKKFIQETGITSRPKIITIRLGDTIPVNVTKQKSELMSRKHAKSFAISVGTIEARKNHVQLYIALKLAQQLGVIDNLPHIYIIGRQGWLSSDTISHFRRDYDIRNKVTILEDVSDQELAWFYKNALFSIYVSQYEGWGLPIAESLTYGTPVIASNTSSMKEIAPQLVKAVSPYDTNALLQAMLQYVDHDINELARREIKKGYKSTTWADTLVSINRIL